MLLRHAVPVLLAGALLAGCGAEDDSTEQVEASPVEVVRSAGDRVVEEGSSRQASESVGSMEGLEFRVTGEGVADYEAGTAEFTVDMPAVEQEVTIRVLPDDVFMSGVPGVPPDQWVRFDAEHTPAPGGADFSSFADPALPLLTMRGAEDVTEVGTETVRGDETTRYSGTLDMERVVEEAPPEHRAPLERQLELMRGADLDRTQFEAWVDEQGRLRRLSETVTFDPHEAISETPGAPRGSTAPPEVGELTTTTTTDFFDFGVAVEVEEPPADRITEGPPTPPGPPAPGPRTPGSPPPGAPAPPPAEATAFPAPTSS